MATVRKFNTAGPVVAADHYHIPPLERIDLDAVLGLIRDKQYFVLHAPRQTGKTSVLLALRVELSRFGGQATSAFRDTVADRTVVPTECRVKGTIPHAGRLRAAETAAIAGSCIRVAGGGRAARSRRSAKDDRIRGSLRVPRSGGKDRSGPL